MNLDHFLIKQSEKIINAMKAMDLNGHGILFVTEDNVLKGSITDGDIRRWIIKNGDLSKPVINVANLKPVYLYLQNQSKAKEIITSKLLKAIPIIEIDGTIQSIIFSDKIVQETSHIELPVVLMAGGKGTRLKPYTDIIPKPLIPVGKSTILERIIDRFLENGINTYYLILNYKKNLIKAYFEDLKIEYNLQFIEEEKPLGTGGGISLLKNKIKTDFILSNSDIIINANYKSIINFHYEKDNFITIVSALKTTEIPYGVIESDKDGYLLSTKEKPSFKHLINTGFYIVNLDVINDLEFNESIDFPQIIDNYITKGKKIGVYPIPEEAWLDMGQFKELSIMKQKLEVYDE